MLIHHVYDVALVFGHVVTANKFPHTVFLNHTCVMASCDSIKTQNDAALVQTVEFQVTVAFDTWVWRDTNGVVVDIGLNHIAMKIFGEVKDQMVDTQLLGDSSSVVDVAHTAATRVAVSAPQAHRDSDDFVTLFKQQGSRN
jgi:hypothetical protein